MTTDEKRAEELGQMEINHAIKNLPKDFDNRLKGLIAGYTQASVGKACLAIAKEIRSEYSAVASENTKLKEIIKTLQGELGKPQPINPSGV